MWYEVKIKTVKNDSDKRSVLHIEAFPIHGRETTHGGGGLPVVEGVAVIDWISSYSDPDPGSLRQWGGTS